MDTLTALGPSLAGWGAAGVGLAGSLALLRRRLSRDQTEMTKDRMETNFIERLLKDRDAAMAEEREAARMRQVDTEAIARLTAQNEHQAREIARLTVEFAAFKRMILRLHPDMRPFLGSDFPPLIEPQIVP